MINGVERERVQRVGRVVTGGGRMKKKKSRAQRSHLLKTDEKENVANTERYQSVAAVCIHCGLIGLARENGRGIKAA